MTGFFIVIALCRKLVAVAVWVQNKQWLEKRRDNAFYSLWF
jgi:hypothetical protein